MKTHIPPPITADNWAGAVLVDSSVWIDHCQNRSTRAAQVRPHRLAGQRRHPPRLPRRRHGDPLGARLPDRRARDPADVPLLASDREFEAIASRSALALFQPTKEAA